MNKIITRCIPAAIIIIPLVLWRIRISLYGNLGDMEPLAYILPLAFIASSVLNLVFLDWSIFVEQEKTSAAADQVSVVTLLLQLGLLLLVFLS